PKQSKAETFKAIAEEYLAREGGKLKSIDQRKATLERLIYPALGHRPIAEIRRSDIHRLLDKVTDERGPETSHKVYGITKKIMDWHQARSDTFRSPIVRGMSKSLGVKRDRTLTDDELRQLWQTTADGSVFGAYIRMLLLTCARRNEVAGMKRSEIANG